MKQGLTIFLSVAFLALAIFGFWAVDDAGGSHYKACLASLVQGRSCPESPGTLGFVNFHIEAVKTFTTAFFQNFLTGLLALAITLLVVIPNQNKNNSFFNNSALFKQYEQIAPKLAFLPIANWLAFLQNSPNLFSLAAIF